MLARQSFQMIYEIMKVMIHDGGCMSGPLLDE